MLYNMYTPADKLGVFQKLKSENTLKILWDFDRIDAFALRKTKDNKYLTGQTKLDVEGGFLNGAKVYFRVQIATEKKDCLARGNGKQIIDRHQFETERFEENAIFNNERPLKKIKESGCMPYKKERKLIFVFEKGKIKINNFTNKRDAGKYYFDSRIRYSDLHIDISIEFNEKVCKNLQGKRITVMKTENSNEKLENKSENGNGRDVKSRSGIRRSRWESFRRCQNCYCLNKSNICAVHGIEVDYYDVCSHFQTIHIYRGGKCNGK